MSNTAFVMIWNTIRELYCFANDGSHFGSIFIPDLQRNLPLRCKVGEYLSELKLEMKTCLH